MKQVHGNGKGMLLKVEPSAVGLGRSLRQKAVNGQHAYGG